MAKNNTCLDLTWIGKENRPKLEPRILLEDPEKSYHAKFRVKTGSRGDAGNAEKALSETSSAPPREQKDSFLHARRNGIRQGISKRNAAFFEAEADIVAYATLVPDMSRKEG